MKFRLAALAIISSIAVFGGMMVIQGPPAWPGFMARAQNTDAPKRTRPVGKDEDGPPAAVQKIETPKDGMVYVWPLPVHGHQSLVILGVVDGNTVDAAYLVPTRIRIKGATAPANDAKGGKEAQDFLEKQLGGQLRTAQLWGGDPKGGGILGDFWLPPTKEGVKGRWVSDLMIKEGHSIATK